MGHIYSFALIPSERELDGDWHELLKPDPEYPGDSLDEPVDGVEFLEGGQSMNSMFFGMFNEDTRGLWQAFLTGGQLTWDSNGRFIVLDARRRELIVQIKSHIVIKIRTPRHTSRCLESSLSRWIGCFGNIRTKIWLS